MSTFDKGAWGWLPDEAECYVPVQATAPFKAGSPGSVTREGAPMELSAAQTASLLPTDEQSLQTLPNMVDFNELSEAVLLHNLRKRFAVDEIYSSVGTILVAVNPFKLLPLYTPEVLQAYVSAGGAESNEAGKLAPHCWAVAVRAYRALANDYSNQAVCISGESGAGKTESMKLILQALASVSSKASGLRAPDGSGGGGGGGDPEQKSIEQLILSTNPVTEAFGNAKTLRNNNSSRFGKWTSLSFSKSGCITGGSITSYLLEKSRVVFQVLLWTMILLLATDKRFLVLQLTCD